MNWSRLLVSAGVAALCAFQASSETSGELAELFGRADAITRPRLSPNGTLLATGCSPAIMPTICVFDLFNGGDSVVVPRLADVRLVDHYWASDDTLIFDIEAFDTVNTVRGLRDYTFERAVAFNLKKQEPVMLLRDNRAWLDTNNLAAIEPSKDGKALFSIVVLAEDGFNHERRVEVDSKYVYNLMEVNLETGRSKIRKKMTQSVVDAILSPEGEVRAEIRYADKGSIGHEVSVVANGRTIFERSRLEYNPIRVWGLDATGENLVVFLAEGEPYGLFRMALSDGTLIPINDYGGLVGPVIDRRMLNVVGFEYPDDQSVQILEDQALKSQVDAIKGVFPEASVTAESWSDDRTLTVLKVEFPGKPVDFYLFEAATGALSPVGNVAPHLADRTLGSVTPISYMARDGLTIPGYLTLPPGKTQADGPFPLILMPHGGPESRDTLTFDWWAQAYAAAGYAVLQPNFRGSAGFGLEFRNAGYGEFGDKMVLDVADGAAWAVEQGISRPGEACIAGASYGGYSALMVPLQAPGVVKCAIAVNAVTNPFGMTGQEDPNSFYSNYFERYLGADRYASGAAKARITPTMRADEYTIPLLVIASEQDSNVPFEQSDNFRKDVGKRTELEFVRLEGEDHYLRSSIARYQVLQNSLKFLEQNLPAN
ncbi:MAG: S9 family peptidase [Rhodobacterales bacterium]|nr:S9 family peptidase [Rhodobacterales bacterium]